MEQLTKFIGLDVHKDTIAVAVAEDGADREVRFFGTIPNNPRTGVMSPTLDTRNKLFIYKQPVAIVGLTRLAGPVD